MSPRCSAPKRLKGALADLVDGADRLHDREPGPIPLVPVEDRRGLLVIHRQAIANGLGLIVLATHERAAALVACVAGVPTGVWCLAFFTDRAAAEAVHDLVAVDLEAQDRVQRAVETREHAL